jgi:GNAT superfamily N-acetyltransferase
VSVAIAAGLRIRRVGFRSGCDEELKALHAVEALTETDRGSNRMPQALDDHMTFARTLPSQFSDHSLLVETPDGTPIASGYFWFNSVGDERAMECDVLVRRDRRRAGIGSRLMSVICEETAREGRSLLT